MGKRKYIETPVKMWELFLEYKKEVKDNPTLVQDYVGKDAEMVYREKERPLIDKGFFNFCRRKIGCVRQYFENQDGRYSNYIRICSRIKRNIHDDQITGGMTGIYNPSITQRLNNLTDRHDVTSEDKAIISKPITVEIVTPLSDDD
jgi:hypothetical protein